MLERSPHRWIFCFVGRNQLGEREESEGDSLVFVYTFLLFWSSG